MNDTASELKWFSLFDKEDTLRKAPHRDKECQEFRDKLNKRFPLISPFNLQDALWVSCIDSKSCPTISYWQILIVAGSVVASLTGEYLGPEDGESGSYNDADYRWRIWDILWDAILKNPEKLPKEFTDTMLGMFFPNTVIGRERGCPSTETRWDQLHGCRRMASDKSIDYISLPTFQKKDYLVRSMPEPIRVGIGEISKHSEPIRQRVVEHISEKYHW
jgi:hypothetical protein